MKGVGYKRHFEVKMEFLRYSTGELGVISGLFSRRPFIKIYFFHFTILISRFRITEYFPRNFPENFRKFSGKFLTPHLPPVPTPPCYSTTTNTLNPEPTQNLKCVFLQIPFLLQSDVYYLLPPSPAKYQ